MRIYLTPQPGLSRAMTRVAEALTHHLPLGCYVVPTKEQADLEVIHAIGGTEVKAQCLATLEAGRKYALIQYCLWSTDMPALAYWESTHANATAVWSYYNLCDNPGNHYHAPLGIDAAFGRIPDPSLKKKFLLATSGYVDESECLSESSEAVLRAGAVMFHLGPTLPLGNHVISETGINDGELCRRYQQSRFVSGLRRVEGFELPMYEGLSCGARPIAFEYAKHWLGEHALYVNEHSRNLVGEILNALHTYAPVTSDEMRWVREFFAWKPIAEGFWERAL